MFRRRKWNQGDQSVKHQNCTGRGSELVSGAGKTFRVPAKDARVGREFPATALELKAMD